MTSQRRRQGSYISNIEVKSSEGRLKIPPQLDAPFIPLSFEIDELFDSSVVNIGKV